MTRAERELAAKQSGQDADAALTIACRKLGITVEEAQLTPLAVVALAESEIAAARRLSAGVIYGND